MSELRKRENDYRALHNIREKKFSPTATVATPPSSGLPISQGCMQISTQRIPLYRPLVPTDLRLIDQVNLTIFRNNPQLNFIQRHLFSTCKNIADLLYRSLNDLKNCIAPKKSRRRQNWTKLNDNGLLDDRKHNRRFSHESNKKSMRAISWTGPSQQKLKNRVDNITFHPNIIEVRIVALVLIRKYLWTTMSDSGWQTIKPDNVTLIIKRITSATQFKICLSDITRLWSVEGTANDLMIMSRKENPLCEFDQSKVINNIFNLFDKNLCSLKVGDVENTSRVLKMSASLGNMPFNLLWCLKEQSPDVFFKEVTLPLLLTAQDLTLRQNHLCLLLKRKDAEILDYRSENGPPRWRHTKPDNELFVEKEFKAQKFVNAPQNSADPLCFSSNSDLLSILNSKIDHCGQDSNMCANGVKVEPMSTPDKPMESRLNNREDSQIKTEDSGSDCPDVNNTITNNNIKIKVENAGSLDEQKIAASNEGKSKRRKKVKLNI